MQRLEFSGAVRPLYGSLGVKRLRTYLGSNPVQNSGYYIYHLVSQLNTLHYTRRAYLRASRDF